jgi:hypothetical protein
MEIGPLRTVVDYRKGRCRMFQLDLKPEEQEILMSILEVCLSDLRMEIADTDSMDYRDVLKERKQVLIKALAALGYSPG